MKITLLPINFNYNSQKPVSKKQSMVLRAPLACDSVFFGAHIKKTLRKEIENLGEENIPDPILEKAKEAIAQGNDEGVSLFNIHQEYYKDLENSQTLEEVKELYPEFCNVKQVSELAFNKSRNSTSNQIKLGEIKGLTPENTSLILLKYIYCGTADEGFKNLSRSSYEKLKTTLDIPGVKKGYAAYLLSSRLNTDSTFRETASERMKKQRRNEEFSKPVDKASSKRMYELNKNPDVIARRAESISKMHKDPEYAAKRDKNINKGREKLNSSPELRAKQIEATRRKSKEYDYSNIHSEALSRAMEQVHGKRSIELQGAYRDVAKEFPRLGPILTKRNAHQHLDEAERGYLKLYYKTVYEQYPELREHLSNNLGEAYETAYRTVKEEYETAKTEGRLEELLESWEKAKK